jgi:hypothetical protein
MSAAREQRREAHCRGPERLYTDGHSHSESHWDEWEGDSTAADTSTYHNARTGG